MIDLEPGVRIWRAALVWKLCSQLREPHDNLIPFDVLLARSELTWRELAEEATALRNEGRLSFRICEGFGPRPRHTITDLDGNCYGFISVR